MCYYSALSKQRDFVEGEALTLKTLPSGMSSHLVKGFVSEKDPSTMVCLLNGTRLVVREIPEQIQKKAGVGPEAEVVFREGSYSSVGYVADSLIFSNQKHQRRIDLKKLPDGLKADVLPEQKVFFNTAALHSGFAF